MENIVNITKDQNKKIDEALTLAESVAKIHIITVPDYTDAGRILSEVKARYKELDTLRKDITKPIDLAKKNVMALFEKPLTALEKLESFLKTEMISFQNRQEAERRKIEAEARAKQEAEAKKLLEKAEKAMEAGKHSKAGELTAKAELLKNSPVIVPDNAPKADGTAIRENWTFRIVNEMEIPREYLIPDLKKIGAVAKALKNMAKIPGVEVYAEKVMSASAGKGSIYE